MRTIHLRAFSALLMMYFVLGEEHICHCSCSCPCEDSTGLKGTRSFMQTVEVPNYMHSMPNFMPNLTPTRKATVQTNTNTNFYENSYGNSFLNSFGNPNGNSYGNLNPTSNPNAYSNGNSNTNSYVNSNPTLNPNGNSYGNLNPTLNPNLNPNANASSQPNSRKSTSKLARASELFSIKMLHAAADVPQHSDKNFVISPFSIWSLMTLVAEGASDQSLTQLKSALNLPNGLDRIGSSYRDLQRLLFSNTTTVGLSLNQAIFADQNRPLDNDYIQTVSQDFKADHLSVNFRSPNDAAKTINDHIRSQTQGKIENIINPQDLQDTHLLLTSSIFFNGEWKFPFKVSSTKMEPFYQENGEPLGDVPMMTQQNPLKYAMFDHLSAGFVELPYGAGDRLGMLLIYPLRNATLSRIFENLSHFDIRKIHAELYKYEEVGDIIVSLPKFKIDSEMEIRSILRQLGINDVFEATKAKLTKMSKQPTFISQVQHKAIIEVDEIGTVAAATSYANAVDFSFPLEFTFNKPFGFMITDRITKTILFAGQVKNPLA